MTTKPILDVEKLNIRFNTPTGINHVVRDVSFTLGREKLAIVGESGSGKSQTARAILGLTPGMVSARKLEFDGQSLLPLIDGSVASRDSEFYITECTWMRKHGWRTPEWKLILALEPDFHFKPPVELYNLAEDPHEDNNLAESRPEVVADLKARMEAYIAQRESESGLPNPIHHQGDWHGQKGLGPFTSSQQAYDTLHIGDPKQAATLQAKSRD